MAQVTSTASPNSYPIITKTTHHNISNSANNNTVSFNITTLPLTNSVILVAKFDYVSKEPHELDLRKGERLILIDNSKNWWLVRKVTENTDHQQKQTGYVPSNYVKKEKKSLLEKIIPRKLQQINNCIDPHMQQSSNTNNNNNSKPQQLSPPNPTSPYLLNTTTVTTLVGSPNSLINKHETCNGSVAKACVKHKYTANKADELTLNVGTRVNVLEKFVDGWWKVTVENQESTIGLYPSNYLQEETLKIKNSRSDEKVHLPKNGPQHPLDISYAKCESISSNEKEIEYLRVIFSHASSSSTAAPHELNVVYNEIVKLIEDDCECLDSDKSFIKVFNSQGLTGMIPSTCVEPILDNQLNDFVFIRHPTCVGLFANSEWYFGNITRFETILIFNKFATSGDFIVRDSDNGDFSISLKSDSIKHFKVFYKENRFIIGKKVFDNMNDLLIHYHKNPIFDQGGEKLYLVKPFEPPSFDSIFRHASLSSPLSSVN
jgi:NCK adaptor protein